MQLPEDFKEFIELMIASNVRFLMIGGYAYNVYRNPRATGDIDFFVADDVANEDKLRAVLENFGFGEVLEDGKLLSPERVIMLGRSPFRIDILTRIAGVTFTEAESSCRSIAIDGIRIPVISPQLLLKNKQAAARPKDLADVAELKAWLESERE